MTIKQTWPLALLAALFLAPLPASAHLPGQPPFTYVNGQAATYYPIGFSSLPDLAPPQDAAPSQYVVNNELDLGLDSKALPLFPEEVPLYLFSWDFGDGTTATGLDVKHTYTTTGSKVITIKSHDTSTNDEPQLLSTLFLNCVPTANYSLPLPVLVINGITTKNTLSDSINADFTKHVMVDASKSQTGTAPIVSYEWDLGNKQLAKDAKVNVTYDNLYSTVEPVVRITDKNGIFVDATVQLNNTTLTGPDGKPTHLTPTESPSKNGLVVGSLIAAALLVAGIGLLLFRHWLTPGRTRNSKRH